MPREGEGTAKSYSNTESKWKELKNKKLRKFHQAKAIADRSREIHEELQEVSARAMMLFRVINIFRKNDQDTAMPRLID